VNLNKFIQKIKNKIDQFTISNIRDIKHKIQMKLRREDLWMNGETFSSTSNLDPNSDLELGIKFCVFAGAGVFGTAYAGVCKALLEYGLTKKIKYWIGSSAGSIAATFIACGIGCDKLEKILKDTSINKFMDIGGIDEKKSIYDKLVSGASYLEIFTKWGLARGKVMTTWLEKNIEELGYNKALTFSELYSMTGNHLVITATCINTAEVIYFSRSSTPDLSIIEAIRISISIPYIFQPTWSEIDNEKLILVDGAVLNHYPLDVTDVDTNNIIGYNRQCIGFLPVRDGNIMYNREEVTNFIQYSNSILQSLHYRLLKEISKRPFFWERTVPIEVYDWDSKDFNISEDKKNKLIENGYNSTKKYIEERIELIKKYGPIPDNLFISDKVISNEYLTYTNIYDTNPDWM